jgi:antitoxin component YwqK of YwqJK toxin-antitoxin module
MSSAPRKNLFVRLQYLALCALFVNVLSTGCKKVADEENLEERSDGLVYKIGASKPFTGIRTKYHKELEGRRKAFEFHYEDGLLKGPSETYYPHGITERKGEYVVIPKKGSVKHGKFFSWRQNGTLVHRKTYKNGELHGPHLLYHDKWSAEKREASGQGNQLEEDGTIQEEINYVNGLAEGPYRRLQIDGGLLETGSYRGGKFDGEQVYYFHSIRRLLIKDHQGLNRPVQFSATEEGFGQATARAIFIKESTPLSRNPEKKPVSVASFEGDGNFLTIVWHTGQDESISWSDVSKPRPKYRREWRNGKVTKTTWYDPDDERFLFQEDAPSVFSSQ